MFLKSSCHVSMSKFMYCVGLSVIEGTHKLHLLLTKLNAVQLLCYLRETFVVITRMIMATHRDDDDVCDLNVVLHFENMAFLFGNRRENEEKNICLEIEEKMRRRITTFSLETYEVHNTTVCLGFLQFTHVFREISTAVFVSIVSENSDVAYTSSCVRM